MREKLTAQELVDFCIVLLVGGNETTITYWAILCFHEYPQAFDRLKSEPALLPLAIKRFCAIDPRFKPCSGLRATRSDRTIPAGQIVTVWRCQSRRTQFEQAEKFVVARPILILLFGNGIHFAWVRHWLGWKESWCWAVLDRLNANGSDCCWNSFLQRYTRVKSLPVLFIQPTTIF